MRRRTRENPERTDRSISRRTEARLKGTLLNIYRSERDEYIYREACAAFEKPRIVPVCARFEYLPFRVGTIRANSANASPMQNRETFIPNSISRSINSLESRQRNFCRFLARRVVSRRTRIVVVRNARKTR